MSTILSTIFRRQFLLVVKKAQKIRMRDPTYADIANSWGGIFFSGPEGQPSVISQLLERNRRLYEIGPRK